MRVFFRFVSVIFILAALISLDSQAKSRSRDADNKGIVCPNIIFILADDLGWADTTLYGHTSLYETPNLDRLAKRGMVFTRAYANSPLCSPTRVSIMTGQLPARHGSTAPQHHTKAVRCKYSSHINPSTTVT